jgi:hypothetical protein
MIQQPGSFVEATLARSETPSMGWGCICVSLPAIPSCQGARSLHWSTHIPFLARPALISRLVNLDADEVRAELRAQTAAARTPGVQPDHLDSHRHVTHLHSALLGIMLQSAAEYHLAVRMPFALDGHRSEGCFRDTVIPGAGCDLGSGQRAAP